jgi:Uri superfamily endonuclease
MKGVYVLIIQLLDNQSLTLKSLGELTFEKGIWLYVGSATGTGSTNLENRLRRHFRQEKTIYWHIDYLLNPRVTLESAVWAESPSSFECKVADGLEREEMCATGPKGFGASDCKHRCFSHIFHCLRGERAKEIVQCVFIELGLQPRVTIDGSILNTVP